jgi:hypothetical protein
MGCPGREASAIVEVYPALWIDRFAREGRNDDQHAAYAAAEGMRLADLDGNLAQLLKPALQPELRRVAEIEGWILGVS